jgi:hypothetical protein
MVPIMLKDKQYYGEPIVAVRFSKDGMYCGCVFAPKEKDYDEVMLFRLFDKTGVSLLPEKQARKPVRTFRVPEVKKYG